MDKLEAQRIRAARWRKNNPKRDSDYHRRRKYGISPEQFRQMVDDQDNLCSLCGKPETTTRSGVVKSLAVDHDHATGRIRALLCAKCNTALGAFPTVESLQNAISYLLRFTNSESPVATTT